MKQPNSNQQPSGKTEHVQPAEIGSEPAARRLAAPALLFAILAALLFWADTHILSHGGELDARVYYPFVSSNELASFAIREPEDPRVTQGRGLYALVGCNSCHQQDGLGSVATGCPPLAGSDWALAQDPSRIIAIVLKGLTGPITVLDKPYGTGQMVALGSLSDEEIASVLSFVRNNWSNKAPHVEISDVKKIRKQLEGRSAPMTAPELIQLFP
jgi:mono/diheme cytochrome c family protein